MLGWKIQSALCAIVISACPLTAQAQQNTVIDRSLQPLVDAPEGIASPDIMIRPPFVQPDTPNLYLFVVENVGNVDATGATVDLNVSQDATIVNVVPAPSAGNGQWAHVRLKDMAAGSKSIIEVEVKPTTKVVEFVTRLTLESLQTFATAPSPSFASSRVSPRNQFGSKKLPKKVVADMLRAAVADSKYLVAENQDSPVRPPTPLLPATTDGRIVEVQAARPAAPAAQVAADKKLMKTVESLRLAGQDALADAYTAAVANSKSVRAETF